MIFLDALFRFSGIGFLVLLALIALRDGKNWKCKPYLVLSAISVAALFLGYAPETLQPPQPLYAMARFADIPHLVFVWLFALSLYDTGFRLKPIHIIAGVLYCFPILWLRLIDYNLAPPLPPWIFIYGSLTSVALMVHLCYATLRGRSDDLIESRRASRIYFIVTIVFVAVAAAIIDVMPANIGGVDRRTAKILSIWPAVLWGTLWLMAFNQRSAHFGQLPGSGRVLEIREEELKTKLKEIMDGEQAFREPGLTINSLARRIGVNQHQLRALINQGLGYANFSAYLNLYRIDAVKKAMHDPDTKHLPVLSIAMDCGYNSLSTFNKAFKSTQGVTPTAYRKGLKN